MISFNVEQTGDVGLLTLEGEICVQEADNLKTSLIKALNSVGNVYVNVEKVTDIDISCLELFCSAHRTSARQKKTFSLSSKIPDIFSKKVQDGGFKRHVGCIYDSSRTCIWMQFSQ